MRLFESLRQTHHHRFLRMVLSAALVSTILHVCLHDLDASSNGNSSQECEFCHLNNVPFDTPPETTLTLPLVLLGLILLLTAFSIPTQSFRHTLGARAPPLF